FSVQLTDTCVKNSGSHFVVEIGSREFVDNLVSLARAFSATDPAVRQKILALLQSWALAAKGRSDLLYLVETYDMLKREGA
ncbi:Vacuolar protein-sorting-associated protein 27, partial [Cladochytrium tenue]